MSEHVVQTVTERYEAAYFRLRWAVLRAPWGQPPGSERDSDDAVAHHCMVLNHRDEIIGVGRIHAANSVTARIRYMAVAESNRGCGVGRALLQHLETYAARQSVAVIDLNARSVVADFYARQGYIAIGPGPTLFGSVQHVAMRKRL